MLSRIVLIAAIAISSIARAAEVPNSWSRAWPETDFTKVLVDPSEIFSGGPAKDGIPAITDPVMVPATEDSNIAGREPVMSIAIDGAPPRAYPVRYLIWHEIVNDEIAGVPIAVTFCPLCNSGLIFDRRLGGRVLEMGVSGMLRFSDMVMYDRQTESWWQQFTGRSIVGELAGQELVPLPALLESWDAFKTRHPDGLVMAQPMNHRRPYGDNPYRKYDKGEPFLYQGPATPHDIHPLARVVRVGKRAWPLGRLREAGEITEAGLRLSWSEGQASALDAAEIAKGAEVGNVVVVDGTGTAVVHEVVFAFAFHAFTPDGEWMLGDR